MHKKGIKNEILSEYTENKPTPLVETVKRKNVKTETQRRRRRNEISNCKIENMNRPREMQLKCFRLHSMPYGPLQL